MRLNESEQRFVEKLRKQHNAWQRMRVVFMVVGTAMIMTGIFLFYCVCSSLGTSPMVAMALAAATTPVTTVTWIYGAYLIREALHHWDGGDPTRSLVLKLVDELQQKAVKED